MIKQKEKYVESPNNS